MTQNWNKKLIAAAVAAAFALPVADAFAAKNYDDSRRNEEEEPKIVKEARIVEEGRNKALETTAREDGQVWLYDHTNKEVVHSITLRKGQTYGIDPDKNYVIVNGKEGEGFKFNPRSTYRIYYVTEEDRDAKNDRRSARDDERRGNKRSDFRVPDSAEVVMEGRDKEMSVRATERGTYYLYDATNKNVLDIYNVVEGDRLTIVPRDNAVSVNGKKISEDITLDRRTEYRLLFNKQQQER